MKPERERGKLSRRTHILCRLILRSLAPLASASLLLISCITGAACDCRFDCLRRSFRCRPSTRSLVVHSPLSLPYSCVRVSFHAREFRSGLRLSMLFARPRVHPASLLSQQLLLADFSLPSSHTDARRRRSCELLTDGQREGDGEEQISSKRSRKKTSPALIRQHEARGTRVSRPHVILAASRHTHTHSGRSPLRGLVMYMQLRSQRATDRTASE